MKIMVDAGAEECWELTVPANDAELLAELRRHGVRPGRRLRLVVSDPTRPGADTTPEFFASYAGAPDASERAEEILAAEFPTAVDPRRHRAARRRRQPQRSPPPPLHRRFAQRPSAATRPRTRGSRGLLPARP